jgi:hypothetical protein
MTSPTIHTIMRLKKRHQFFFMINNYPYQIDHCTVMRTVVATYGLSERASKLVRAHSFRSTRAPLALRGGAG